MTVLNFSKISAKAIKTEVNLRWSFSTDAMVLRFNYDSSKFPYTNFELRAAGNRAAKDIVRM